MFKKTGGKQHRYFQAFPHGNFLILNSKTTIDLFDNEGQAGLQVFAPQT
jgi:hypothetical protein